MSEMPPSQPPEQPVYVQQMVPPEVSSTGTIALVLEIIFGYAGILGTGNIYAKRTGTGILLLFGWWVYLAIAGFISVITLGIALVCFGPISIALPIISGVMIRSHVLKEQVVCDTSDLLRTVGIGIGVGLFFCVVIGWIGECLLISKVLLPLFPRC